MTLKRKHAHYAATASTGLQHATKFIKTTKDAKKIVKRILDKHRKGPSKSEKSKKTDKRPVIESTAFPDKLTLHMETHKAHQRSKLIRTLSGNSKINITTSGGWVNTTSGTQFTNFIVGIGGIADVNNSYINAARQYNATAPAAITSDPTIAHWNNQMLNISRMETHFRLMNNEPAVMDVKFYYIVSTSDQLIGTGGIDPVTAWTADLAATTQNYAAGSQVTINTLDEVPHGPNFKKLFRIEKSYSAALGPGCVHHGKWIRNVNKIMRMEQVQQQAYYKGISYWILAVTQGPIVNDSLGYTIGATTIGFTKCSYVQTTKINGQVLTAQANGERLFNSLPAVGAQSYLVNPDTAAVVDIRVAGNVA